MFLFQGSYHSDISTKCVRLCSQPSATPSPGVDNQLLLFNSRGRQDKKLERCHNYCFRAWRWSYRQEGYQASDHSSRLCPNICCSHTLKITWSRMWAMISVCGQPHTLVCCHDCDFCDWSTFTKVELHTKPRSASPQRMQTFFFCLPVGMTQNRSGVEPNVDAMFLWQRQ